MDLITSFHTHSNISELDDLELQIEQLSFDDFYEESWENKSEQDVIDEALSCIKDYKEKVDTGYKDKTIHDVLSDVTISYSISKTPKSVEEVTDHLFDIFAQVQQTMVINRDRDVKALQSTAKDKEKGSDEQKAINVAVRKQRKMIIEEKKFVDNYKKATLDFVNVKNRQQIDKLVTEGQEIYRHRKDKQQQTRNFQRSMVKHAKLKQQQDQQNQNDSQTVSKMLIDKFEETVDITQFAAKFGKDINYQKMIDAMNAEIQKVDKDESLIKVDKNVTKLAFDLIKELNSSYIDDRNKELEKFVKQKKIPVEFKNFMDIRLDGKNEKKLLVIVDDKKIRDKLLGYKNLFFDYNGFNAKSDRINLSLGSNINRFIRQIDCNEFKIFFYGYNDYRLMKAIMEYNYKEFKLTRYDMVKCNALGGLDDLNLIRIFIKSKIKLVFG